MKKHTNHGDGRSTPPGPWAWSLRLGGRQRSAPVRCSMRMTRTQAITIPLALILALSPLAAPVAAQTIPTESGQLEFIGLERWSPRALLDTLRTLDPGRPLHACAVVLKDQLGFPDASVSYYEDPGDTSLVVMVVEPEHRSRVQYLPTPRDSAPLPVAWSVAAEVARNDRNAFIVAVQLSGAYRGDSLRAERALDGVPFPVNRDAVWTVWRVPAAGESADQLRTIQLLRSAADPVVRMVALARIAEDASDDASWWAVVDALRDPDEVVNGVAIAALRSMAQWSARTVDWWPATASVRAVLGGTNLFAFRPLVEALAVTSVAPSLAGPLLADNASLLLQAAAAHHEGTRRSALRLLEQLGGGPRSVEQWRIWAEALKR